MLFVLRHRGAFNNIRGNFNQKDLIKITIGFA